MLEVPTLRIGPPSDHRALVEAIAGLNEYEWLVFTSANGVGAFFEHFFKAFQDLRDLGGARLAAVGPATAARLRELHLQVDLMPDEARATQIVAAFRKYQSMENVRVLLLRAQVANPELPRELEALGAIVDDVACYQTLPETDDPGGVAARLIAEGADWVTFASGSSVEHFHARFDLPKLRAAWPRLGLASIGPETSKALRALGLVPDVEARTHTGPGLVTAIEQAVRKQRRSKS